MSIKIWSNVETTTKQNQLFRDLKLKLSDCISFEPEGDPDAPVFTKGSSEFKSMTSVIFNTKILFNLVSHN